MAAAVPIIKVVGVAMSAKMAYDGIKEGNFFEAVVGAVGAYYGVSSLASTATSAGSPTVQGTSGGAAQTTTTAGAQASEKVSAQAAAKGIEGAGLESLKVGADNLTREAAKAAASGGGSAGGNLLDSIKITGEKRAGMEAPSFGAKTTETGLESINRSIEEGATQDDFLDGLKVSGKDRGTELAVGGSEGGGMWGKAKGLLSKGIEYGNDNPFVAQAGLNVAGGYMSAKAEEQQLDRQEDLYRERLHRRSTPADTSRASKIQWDPNSRRFTVQGAA